MRVRSCKTDLLCADRNAIQFQVLRVFVAPILHTGDIPRNISFTGEAKNTFFKETPRFIASELFEILKCRHSDISDSPVAVSMNVAWTYVLCCAVKFMDCRLSPSYKIGVIYTGCNRRNGPDFGRVFLRSNYTDITQNTYIQSWTVTEILAREKSGLLWCLRTVLVSVTSFSTLLELHSYIRANVAPAT